MSLRYWLAEARGREGENAGVVEGGDGDGEVGEMRENERKTRRERKKPGNIPLSYHFSRRGPSTRVGRSEEEIKIHNFSP